MSKMQVSPLAVALLGGAMWANSISAHELIGHGGVCALDPNCTWAYADAMFFHGELQEGAWVTTWRAAGSLLNLGIGMFAAWLLWTRAPTRLLTHVALWQLMAISFLQSGSYIAFGWAIDPGMDWAIIASQSDNPDHARKLVVIAGGSIISMGLILCSRFLPRENRVLTLSASYSGFVITAVLAAANVPTDDRFYMLMGGFGSSALFMSWMWLLLLPGSKGRSYTFVSQGRPLIVGALSMGAIATYVFLLAPGLHF